MLRQSFFNSCTHTVVSLMLIFKLSSYCSLNLLYEANESQYLIFLALEPRNVTRWDIHRYAREAYNLGVRYIGGCCGFEAYHIRAIAEELSEERGGKLPPGSEKHGLWGSGNAGSAYAAIRKR